VPLGDGRTYAELEAALQHTAESILDMVADAEAQDIVKRITASEPVLAVLIADRYQQQVRQHRIPDHRDFGKLAGIAAGPVR
jgi:hypothetical protein